MTLQNNITVSDIRTLSIKIIFLKNLVETDPDADSIQLKVYDNEGTQRGPTYTLTSSPELQYIPSTKTYYLDIDVSNFPDGNIQAHWFGVEDSVVFHDLTHTDRIVNNYTFESREPIVRMGNQVLSQPTQVFYKKYANIVGPYALKDNSGTRYTPYLVQAVIRNPFTQVTVDTITLSEVMDSGLHTGIYEGSWTPNDLLPFQIYNLYLQIQERSTDPTLTNIDATRVITLMDRPTSVTVEPALMATPRDVKTVCTNIDEYINAKSEAEREMIVYDALKMSHDFLMGHIGAMQYKYQNPLLREAEAIGAAYIIIRANITLDPKLADRFKDDFNDRVATVKAQQGQSSEKIAIFC